MTATKILNRISDYAIKAASLPDEYENPKIQLNLQEIAPALLEDALHPNILDAGVEREERGGIEFAMPLLSRSKELKSMAIVDILGRSIEGKRIADQYVSMLINDDDAPLELVPDLIVTSERIAMAYETCQQIEAMERQRRGIAARGPGCGMSWVRWQYDHVDEHHSRMAAWLRLAAYLAVRLDAVGRALELAVEVSGEAE